MSMVPFWTSGMRFWDGDRREKRRGSEFEFGFDRVDDLEQQLLAVADHLLFVVVVRRESMIPSGQRNRAAVLCRSS